MKRIVIGNLAHVDAGKTSLSEAMLYEGKAIKQIGRVDNKNSFLDTSYMERARGITIFSKQAVFEYGNTSITLIDTPGHVDFSPEMERVLNVLDYAVLVVSGSEGIQSHTRTLWQLLSRYRIPTFIFVNKMDQPLADKNRVYESLRENFGSGIVDFTIQENEAWMEQIALTDENVLESFLETGRIDEEVIRGLVSKCKVVPVYFGSALKNYGVKELLEGLDEYTMEAESHKDFGAYVYKISRDEQGNRLTHLKVTGGSLAVKDFIGEEKVNQIRVYSGERYEAVSRVVANQVCAVLGCEETSVGMSVGTCELVPNAWVTPVLNYKLMASDNTDIQVLYGKIHILEEEEPSLHVSYDENLKEISIEVCGNVQMEILKQQMLERFGIEVEFGKGRILYMETVALGTAVMGVGHFEPLRHYAEVHVLIEPGTRGSGINIENRCGEDILEKSWQNTVLSCLRRKRHRGVLTGFPLTDVKITLLAGRAHKKHTEGGDFFKAASRAVRQGLMQAENVLLEPYYDYILEIPSGNVGRAISDIEQMNGTYNMGEDSNGIIRITGSAPVSAMYDYQSVVVSYTRGEGRLFLTPGGYEECHNSEEIVEQMGYNPQSDIANTPDSVFCANGAGYTVTYDKVFEYMHVENTLQVQRKDVDKIEPLGKMSWYEEESIGVEEIDEIIEKTFYANKKGQQRNKNGVIKRKVEDISSYAKHISVKENLPQYLLVDGYNIIYAWEELSELAKETFDGARGRLLDIMCNYQAVKGCKLIVVFDAYKVKGHKVELMEYHNISVVYTKEAQTADRYIESFAHENSKQYDITVATSDGLEQIIIRGAGCKLMSARELEEQVKAVQEKLRQEYKV